MVPGFMVIMASSEEFIAISKYAYCCSVKTYNKPDRVCKVLSSANQR